MGTINIFGINIPMYSLMIILGLLIGNIVAVKVIINNKLNLEDFIVLEAYGLAFGMFGAKLLYLWININNIQWSRFFEFEYFNGLMRGGFVFYGGLIGGIIGVVIAHKIHKIDVKKYFAQLIYCIPLVHAFGRIGCYFAGCCYGMPYDGVFHVEYHNNPYSLCDVKLFPVQLVEAISLIILAIIFYILIRKKGSSLRWTYLYFISYSIVRFILEMFRYDYERGSVGIFSTSQWISICILTLMIILLIISKKKK